MSEDRYTYYTTTSYIDNTEEKIIKEIFTEKDYISFIDKSTGEKRVLLMDNDVLTTAPIAVSLEIESYPNKIEYFNGSAIKLDGLVIKATATDGSTFIVDNSLITCEPEYAIMGTDMVKLKYFNYGEEKFVRCNISVLDMIASEYEVSDVSGATYGFALQSDGYYMSTNTGVDYSYSMCRVDIVNPMGCEVLLDCISYGESNYDYGILSNVDAVLDFDYDYNETDRIFYTFKGKSSSSVQTVSYGDIQSGFITIKYIKDSSSSSGTDTFKFKVRFV